MPPALDRVSIRPSGRGAAVPPDSARAAYFDNVRFVLLALVVVGHAIEPLRDHPALRTAYHAIYACHMPVFVWLAGRFASADLTPARAARLVERVVLPLLLFQVAYSAFHHFAFATPALAVRFVQPYWILWFLMSLLWWRLLLPLFVAVPGGLLVAVALALVAGRSDAIGYDLSLSRTLVFLPFFLLGYQMRRQDLPALATGRARVAAVVVLAGLLAAAWHFAPRIDARWLYGSVGYGVLGVPGKVGMALRLAQGGVALLAGAAVLALVPRGRYAWTSLGARTLQGFLLHGLLVRGASAAGWLAQERWASPWAQAGLAVGAVLLAAALCSAVVERWLGWLVAPPIGRWLRAG